LEVVVAKIKDLSQHLPVGTEENCEKLSQDNKPLAQCSNMEPPRYKV